MRIYEELFIVDPNATDEQIDSVTAQIEGVVKDANGTIDKIDKWGVRKLAYRVKKRDEGQYVLVQFSADPAAVREIERRLRVDETVLKYLTVRIDEDLKWIEKKRKEREKRASRRPKPPASAPGAPAHAAPGAPAAPAAPAQPEPDEDESPRQADE